jgi:hypothetical protein
LLLFDFPSWLAALHWYLQFWAEHFTRYHSKSKIGVYLGLGVLEVKDFKDTDSDFLIAHISFSCTKGFLLHDVGCQLISRTCSLLKNTEKKN